MAETSGIDRVFDFIDSGIDKIDGVINRGKQTEDKFRARQAREVPSSSDDVKLSSSTAIVRRRFRIIESTDAQTGEPLYVVTDGTARAECNMRATAEKILIALETA